MNLDILTLLTLLTEGRQNGLAPGNITATALRRSSAKKRKKYIGEDEM